MKGGDGRKENNTALFIILDNNSNKNNNIFYFTHIIPSCARIYDQEMDTYFQFVLVVTTL